MTTTREQYEAGYKELNQLLKRQPLPQSEVDDLRDHLDDLAMNLMLEGLDQEGLDQEEEGEEQ